MDRQLIKQAMVIRIKPSDITYLVKKLEELRDAGIPTPFEVQIAILLKRHGSGRSAKIFAILERKRCLLELMSDDRMHGWTLEGNEPGCILTNEAVFAATARCRLLDRENTFFFDADEFFSLLID